MDVGGLYGEYNLDILTLNLLTTSDLVTILLKSIFQSTKYTAAINELLCLKNVGAQISMFFTSNEKPAPMAIKTIKILGDILELPARQQC